jgi:mevalonate pyrophosphate decarboxylase
MKFLKKLFGKNNPTKIIPNNPSLVVNGAKELERWAKGLKKIDDKITYLDKQLQKKDAKVALHDLEKKVRSLHHTALYN